MKPTLEDNLMDMLMFFTLFALMILASLGLSWLDHKYNVRLTDWLNGKTDNPFKPRRSISQVGHMEGLRERIEILEKIVTEPAYELNKKINALK
ncbi:hypothetical protein P2G88_15620 [Aliiglaciecola sp. CAU 1673]|uniref:hypothetical protein n=1 Tax=Aliiglaciecola sp. CAU 1673 TaxID=3032595 RepID=UPI0023DBB900|nr:hypothetical protein [Aliiglaciecola sp. CAU 1673]MDF2179679.1 hypothetical protein [Aliiglaciecola sp. CAU 1673]